MAPSRTKLAIKNSVIATGFYFINLVLQFVSRRYFLEYLGTEVLGLSSTAQNLLQFLNLAELGIDTAVGFTLFKPLADKDIDKINDVVTLNGMLYRRIGLFVLAGGLILSAFFPLIFAKMDLPLWYAYACFGTFLLGSLLSYFVNYKQIVLTANQEGYKIQICYKPLQFVKVILQIFAVKYLENGFIYWIALEAICYISMSILVTKMTRISHPYLKNTKKTFRQLAKEYKEFTVKIKQLFIHKISLFVLSQTAPLIIYAYISLTMVTLYGNYQMISLGLSTFVAAIFNSIGGGIGNLIHTSEKSKIIKVFDELFSLRFLIASVLCFCAFVLTPSFIVLWVGEEYILPQSTLFLMIVILFIGIARGAVENFIYAYGLYSDVWAAGAEAAINLGFSIIFGYFWGLNGILCGVILSLLVIILGWKPYYLFTKALRGYLKHYLKSYLLHLCCLSVSIIISLFIIQYLTIDPSVSFANFLAYSVTTFAIFGTVMFITLYVTNSGIKSFVIRFIKNK